MLLKAFTMETKSFYIAPAAVVVELKTECVICNSQQQTSNSAIRSGYGPADEI